MSLIRFAVSLSSDDATEAGDEAVVGDKANKKFLCLPQTLVCGHSNFVKDMLDDYCGDDYLMDGNDAGGTATTASGKVGGNSGHTMTRIVRFAHPSATDGEADDDSIEVPLPPSGNDEADHMTAAFLVEWLIHYSGAATAYPKPRGELLGDLLVGTKKGGSDDGSSMLLSLPQVSLVQSIVPPALPPKLPTLPSAAQRLARSEKLSAKSKANYEASSSNKQEDATAGVGGTTSPIPSGAVVSGELFPNVHTTNILAFFERVLGNQWEAEFVVYSVLLGGEEGHADDANDGATVATSSRSAIVANTMASALFGSTSPPLNTSGRVGADIKATSTLTPQHVYNFHRRLYFLSSAALFLDMPRLHAMCCLVTAAMIVGLMECGGGGGGAPLVGSGAATASTSYKPASGKGSAAATSNSSQLRNTDAAEDRQAILKGWFGADVVGATAHTLPHRNKGFTPSEKQTIADRFAWCTNEVGGAPE